MHWVAWFNANRKRVAKWGGITVGVIVVVASIVYYENQKEVRASEALSEILWSPGAVKAPPRGTAEAFLKVEKDFPGSKAAARALLQAAGVRFVEEKYPEAQALFSRFEKDYPESPWLPEALLGYASTLDVQRNTNALAEYEKLKKRYPNDAIAEFVKLNLARLYEKQNNNKEAFNLYQDLLSKLNPRNSSIAAEAEALRDDLVLRFPNLVQTNAPATPVTITPSASTLTNLIRFTNAPKPRVLATNLEATNVTLQSTPPVRGTNAPGAAPK